MKNNQNNFNSCCYDHMVEDEKNNATENSKSESVFKFYSARKFAELSESVKYWLTRLAPSVSIAIIAFLLNIFNK